MPPHLASAPNVNHLWAALLVEELVRQGTTFFAVCPGSRSTPLAVAVAQNPRAEALVHWDERAAAFVALGWGRATGRPAAVVTTSGTAVANLLPAAVEADADGVPLLLITADRPPELRETGANQTIRQPPIFQDVARWTLDWPVPTTDVPARWVLSTAAHAAHRAASGPVHLNLPFREPLGAQPDGVDMGSYLSKLGESWFDEGDSYFPEDSAYARLYRSHGRWEASVKDVELLDRLREVGRGVVVVGEGQSAGSLIGAIGAIRTALALEWPLIPDVRSLLRRGGGGSPVLAPYADLALSSEALRSWGRPEAVLHLGGRITSKRVLRLLADAQPRLYVQVGEDSGRNDPDTLVTDRIDYPVYSSLEPLFETSNDDSVTSAWVCRWGAASAAVEDVLQELLDRGESLSEPFVARTLARRADVLVAAASMPIRDVEAYAPAERAAPRPVTANRGASGIDGTVATAYGVALTQGGGTGAGRPVFALVGDLALLHDQTSLSLLRSGPPVVVVVVNNDGGGIFHRLPIASGTGALDGDTFERFFGTPHGLTFEHAAAQYGLAYHTPDTVEAFGQAIDVATASGASALIEVRTDREEQAALRRRIEAACAEAVDAALA